MCTVSYLPLPSGFLLTSNRDEWNKRLPALPPLPYDIHQQTVTFPRDQQANGTWIATNHQYTLCLLNGAFQKHESQPPYRLSRGLMLLDFFKYLNPLDFASSYDFSGIENFTLLIKSNIDADFFELRWDGIKLHLTSLDPLKPQIWSSCTLYTDEVIAERRSWFEKWLAEQVQFSSEDIISFHRFAGKGDKQNDVLMERENGVQTVSVTHISSTAGQLSMRYWDINENKEFEVNVIANAEA